MGNVPNVATNDQTPTYTVASANAELTSGEKLSVAFGKIAKAISSLIAHIASTGNVHSMTKADIGLGNVDNTADANKSVASAATATTLTGLTATVAELNYMDGVTSAVQTQLDGKSATGHGHAISEITNLQTTLDGKSATGHTHTIANITNLQSTLDTMQEAIDSAGGGGSFCFDALIDAPGYTYTYVSSTGVETIKSGSTTYATRTSTKNSSTGVWTVVTVCSAAGINVTKTYTPSSTGWSSTTSA